MKNTLLTTTALALTSFAGTASAVEVAAGAVNLNIGGFFRTTVAVSNVDLGAGATNKDYDGVDILTNSEIWFKPSITLDNGITIGADVELEGNTASDQIDESTIFAKGAFGKVELGSKDSAGKQMQVGAPDVSLVYANSSSLSAFVPFTGPTTFPDFANDADRLTYFTPDFGGFQVGVSYARDKSQTNGPVDNNKNAIGTDYADIGITYKGTVGTVNIGFSARYGTYDQGFDSVGHLKALTDAATAFETKKRFDTGNVTGAAHKITAVNAATALGTTAVAATAAAATALSAANALDNGILKTAAVNAATALGTTAVAATAAAATALSAANALTPATALSAATAAADPTDIYASSTAAINKAAGRNPTVAGVGLKLGFGDFAIGGGYVERDMDIVGQSNEKTYDIGVSYATGPMGYSLTYVHGETAGNVAELTSLVAAATYTFNSNFFVGASLSAYEKDVTVGTKDDIDGMIFALSAQFNF